MAEINITHACNQKCIFCIGDRNSHKVFLTGPTLLGPPLKQIYKEIEDSLYNVISFTGGETLLRKDIFQIIRFAKKCNKTIGINTNGQLLESEDLVAKLKRAGVTNLMISLHTQKISQNSQITNSFGSFAKVVEGIRNAKKYGFYISIEHVIFENNYKDLSDFVHFVRKEFCSVDNIDFLFIRYNNKPETARLIPGMSKALPHITKAFDICEENKQKYRIQNIPYCVIQKYAGFNYYYDWSEDLIRKEIKINDYGFKKVECKDCIYDRRCVGLTRFYACKFGLDELNPIKNKGNEKPIGHDADYSIKESSFGNIPPCYHTVYEKMNRDRKTEIMDFWSDSDRVVRFMVKRKKKLRDNALTLDFCRDCKWNDECIGIERQVWENMR